MLFRVKGRWVNLHIVRVFKLYAMLFCNGKRVTCQMSEICWKSVQSSNSATSHDSVCRCHLFQHAILFSDDGAVTFVIPFDDINHRCILHECHIWKLLNLCKQCACYLFSGHVFMENNSVVWMSSLSRIGKWAVIISRKICSVWNKILHHLRWWVYHYPNRLLVILVVAGL